MRTVPIAVAIAAAVASPEIAAINLSHESENTRQSKTGRQSLSTAKGGHCLYPARKPQVQFGDYGICRP